MAWFAGVSSSLKGQISNLAKNVLAEDDDGEGAASTSRDDDPGIPITHDTFVGQEPQDVQPYRAEEDEVEEISLIPRKLANFLSLGKGSDSEEQIAILQEENRNLRIDNETKVNEIRRYRRMIQDLENMAAMNQDENSNLSTGMEDMDLRHQQSLEQAFNVNDETHKELDALKADYLELETRFVSLSEENKKEKKKLVDENAALKIELDFFIKQKQRVEFLEKELKERDTELETIELENSRLRSEIEALNNTQETLATIPEHSEEVQENEVQSLEQKIISLNSDVDVLREVRSNLETEVNNSRVLAEELSRRLQISEGTLRNQENLQISLDQSIEKKIFIENQLLQSKKYAEELEIELESMKKENESLKQDLSSKDKDKEVQWYEYTAKEKHYQEETESLKKKLQILISQLKETDQHLETAQKDIEIKDKKLCEYAFEVNTLQEEISKKNKDPQLVAKIKELELQLEEIKDNKDTTDEEKILKEKYQLIVNENNKLKDQLKNFTIINAELEESVKKCENMQMELDKLLNIANEYLIFKDASKEKENEFKNRLEAKEEEAIKLNQIIETKTNEIISLKLELEQPKQQDLENAKLLNTLQDLENKIEHLEKEKETLSMENETRIHNIRKELESYYENIEKEQNQKLLAISQITKDQEAEITRLKEDASKKIEEMQQSKILLEQNLKTLDDENKELKKKFQINEVMASGLASEIENLNTQLKKEKEKIEKILKEKELLNETLNDTLKKLEEKENYIDQAENMKSKEATALKQEVESLKNQLEYATQLMHVAERQEAEGRGVTPPPQADNVEEIGKLTNAFLKEQTENKLLKNQIEEVNEKNSKLANQLARLKDHLVSIEEHYTSVEMASQNRIAELEAKQVEIDDWVKSSSTAYTSANIRANQQVEVLTQQVKQLTEHKERLEVELSKAEDNSYKQQAAVTNLQAVLSQFQKDKDKDIMCETERITLTLNQAYKKIESLEGEKKQIREQLKETQKGLAAASRLNQQLDQKCEEVKGLELKVSELIKKQNEMDQKLKYASCTMDSKVDKNLLKNLFVGYASSGPKSKEQALRVIAQVLDLTLEEKQRIGLEPCDQKQQSLSEAFIRFLESESQPKQQVILPLSTPPSRKTSQSSGSSLLLEENNLNLPHFVVGRTTGSMLKSVLKDNEPDTT